MISVDDRGTSVWVTLERPEALNALSREMVEAIHSLLAEISGREQLCALVITGKGKAFCTGSDLKGAQQRMAGTDPASANAAFLASLRRTFSAIEAFPLPVIAAVNGYALAGGLELLSCCELIIASETALFGDAHARYGLLPGAGGSVRLPRKIGQTRAKYMVYTGEFIPAARMAEWGLVHEVVPPEELMDATEKLVALLASRSPLGLRRMKSMIEFGLRHPAGEALDFEAELNRVHWTSDDRAEGLAAFAEKRPPKFRGQ